MPGCPLTNATTVLFKKLGGLPVCQKYAKVDSGRGYMSRPRFKDGVICKSFLVKENPHLPTVALDLDGTLVHTLVDPEEITVSERLGLKSCRLPGNMGVSILRPGLEQLFSALLGYNVVIFSAGGRVYVNTAMNHLMMQLPFMQNRICKVLTRDDLTRYSLQSQLPSSTALSKDGVNYVKDLRKVRQDGKTDKVITIDDNLEAYRVIPVMEDDSFRERYNFAKNTLLVPEFIGTSPEALHDTVFAKVSRVLQEILTKEDKCEALTDHYLTVDMMVRLVSADSTDSVMTHVVSNSSRCGETIVNCIAV
jgi:hypothetical protein